jgi:predicted nuclease of predicted toxin-antitoxin system
MKLLFDENLSPRLPGLLKSIFPDSVHARDCGLLGQPDEDVWEYAGANGLTIISKDSDFQQRSLLYGYPPKVVWLRVGNCSRQQLVDLITSYEVEIRDLDQDKLEAILILS